MKEVIERIYKRTTEYSYPSQATTTANALDLLSSGIYTEEERFVFELLQNAVDSFEPNAETELYIKIVLTDDHLVFMHNGTPFTERDLEGLCDIGNGNKMNDAKKIGYKGIGFDVIGLDPIADENLTRHKKLFAACDMVNIENLKNLDQCGSELFRFSCYPLKLEGSDGSPVRAVAWFD